MRSPVKEPGPLDTASRSSCGRDQAGIRQQLLGHRQQRLAVGLGSAEEELSYHPLILQQRGGGRHGGAFQC